MIGRQSGFTLLELVVAMSIFAIMAVMAYGGLDQVLRAKDASEEVMDQVARMQLAWSLIGRDLGQAMPRPIRDILGDSEAAFIVGDESLIEFTRGGWPNPLRRSRGYLQRVAYRLDGDKLQRLSWNVLDRAQDSEPRVTDLIEGVEAVELRVRQANGEWGSGLDSDDGEEGASTAMPSAIELRLEIAGLGTVNRLFRISEWQPPQAGEAPPPGGKPPPFLPGGTAPRIGPES